jgi:hypothetical protein
MSTCCPRVRPTLARYLCGLVSHGPQLAVTRACNTWCRRIRLTQDDSCTALHVWLQPPFAMKSAATVTATSCASDVGVNLQQCAIGYILETCAQPVYSGLAHATCGQQPVQPHLPRQQHHSPPADRCRVLASAFRCASSQLALGSCHRPSQIRRPSTALESMQNIVSCHAIVNHRLCVCSWLTEPTCVLNFVLAASVLSC